VHATYHHPHHQQQQQQQQQHALATMRKHSVQPRIGAFLNALKKIEATYKDAGLTLG
jgi:hypothetical protein